MEGRVTMLCICDNPRVQIVSASEVEDRLDIPFYDPLLMEIDAELTRLPNLQPLRQLLLPDAPIASGSTPEGGVYHSTGIRFLRVQNIRPMRIRIDDCVFIDRRTHEALSRSTVKRGDVLLTITGATFGNSAVFELSDDQEANVNQHIVRLRVDESRILPRYLALFLNCYHGYGQSKRRTTGGSRPALDFECIANFRVPCPSLECQKQILSRYDVLAEQVESIQSKRQTVLASREKLEKEYELVLEDELGIRRVFPSSDKVRVIRRNQLGDRLDWKAYDPSLIQSDRDLSEGFGSSWTTLRSFATIEDKYASRDASPDEQCKLIRVRLHGRGAELREIKRRGDISGPLARARQGDVIISRIDCTQGAVSLVPAALDGAYVSKEFFLVRVDPQKYLSNLLVRILLSARYVAFLLSFRTGATNRLRLDRDVLLDLRLPATSLTEQERTLCKLQELEAAMKQLALQDEAIVLASQNLMKDTLRNLLGLLDDRRFYELTTNGKDAAR